MVKRVDLHKLFREKYVRPNPGPVLIAGSKVYPGRRDRRKVYENAVGIDQEEGEGVDIVADLENPLLVYVGRFHHIECWSVLEHAKRPWLIAQNLESMLTPMGSIHITVPFVWRIHGYPSDYWRFTIEAIRELFPRIEWQTLLYAHTKLDSQVPGGTIEGHKFFPKCEVFGFGLRKYV